MGRSISCSSHSAYIGEIILLHQTFRASLVVNDDIARREGFPFYRGPGSRKKRSNKRVHITIIQYVQSLLNQWSNVHEPEKQFTVLERVTVKEDTHAGRPDLAYHAPCTSLYLVSRPLKPPLAKFSGGLAPPAPPWFLRHWLYYATYIIVCWCSVNIFSDWILILTSNTTLEKTIGFKIFEL